MQRPSAAPGGPSVLVLIDVQRGFDDASWGARNNPDAERRIADLLRTWRQRRDPVIHVQHASRLAASPLRAGQPGHEIKSEAAPAPGEPVLSKSVNSAFIGTDLEARLRRLGNPRVVLAGFTTAHCVSTTARMAGNLGFETAVVTDATVAYELPDGRGGRIQANVVHDVALSELRDEFAAIVTAEELGAAVVAR